MIRWKMYWKKVKMNGVEKSIPFFDLFPHDRLMYTHRCKGEEYEVGYVKKLMTDALKRKKERDNIEYAFLIEIIDRCARR